MNYLDAFILYWAQLIIISIFSGILYLIYRIRINKDLDTYLSFAGILLAILFFLLQNFQSVVDKYKALDALNKYNCFVAENLWKKISYDLEAQHVTLMGDRYETDFYKTNLDLLYRAGSTNSGAIFSMIGLMDNSNHLLDMKVGMGEESVTNFIQSTDMDRALTSSHQYFELIHNFDSRIAQSASGIIKKMNQINKVGCEEKQRTIGKHMN